MSAADHIDHAEHAYWRAFCPACGESPCTGCTTPEAFVRTHQFATFGSLPGECIANLWSGDRGTIAVEWTDGINEWREEYPSIAPALARLALLAECGAEDWSIGFADNPDQHTARWGEFVAGALQ